MVPNQPDHPGASALTFVSAYARKAVTRNVDLRGRFPRWIDAQDVVQDVHERLTRTLGPGYDLKIARARLNGWEGTQEHRALKAAVKKAISAARDTSDKRRQRGLPQEVALDLGALQEASTRFPLAAETVDLVMDLEAVFEEFSARDRTVWRLSVAGYTVREIGQQIGLDFQRVSEVRQKLSRRICKCLQGPPAA